MKIFIKEMKNNLQKTWKQYAVAENGISLWYNGIGATKIILNDGKKIFYDMEDGIRHFNSLVEPTSEQRKEQEIWRKRVENVNWDKVKTWKDCLEIRKMLDKAYDYDFERDFKTGEVYDNLDEIEWQLQQAEPEEIMFQEKMENKQKIVSTNHPEHPFSYLHICTDKKDQTIQLKHYTDDWGDDLKREFGGFKLKLSNKEECKVAEEVFETALKFVKEVKNEKLCD